ncbi:MAG TPA: hypothetical protein VEC36_11565 [Patescibacteria group bacterium]|nr:hypothetical protein [Patescibacteria group bacterium]
MPVGQFQSMKRSYFSIDKDTGKVKSKDKNGAVQLHDYIEGVLVGIVFEEGEYEGRPSNKYALSFANRDGSEVDILRMGEDANTAYDTLNRLSSIDGRIGWVRLTPYFSEFNGKNITHMSVRHNGEKLLAKFRPDDIPKVTTVKVGKQEVMDKSDKQEFFQKLYRALREKLSNESAAGEMEKYVPADEEFEDEIPF